MPCTKIYFTDYSELQTESEWIVGIDPGHGGMINGKYETAPDKMYDHGEFVFYEGEFNRRVSVLLANLLSQGDISHYFTTNSNLDVSLGIRATRANNYKRNYPEKKHIYLSIHGNAAPKGSETATGIEVFTSVGKTKADPMAEIIYKHLKKMGWRMRKDRSDGDNDKEANFYVLRKTNVPAILVELGFYTNLEEAKKMLDPVVQERLAQHLYSAILEITQCLK